MRSGGRPVPDDQKSAVSFARPEASQKTRLLESASSGSKLSLTAKKIALGEIPDHHGAIEHFHARKNSRGRDERAIPERGPRSNTDRFRANSGCLSVGKQTVRRSDHGLLPAHGRTRRCARAARFSRQVGPSRMHMKFTGARATVSINCGNDACHRKIPRHWHAGSKAYAC